MAAFQMIEQQVDRGALLRSRLGNGLIGQGAVAGEIDDAAVVQLLVIRQ